MADTRQEVRKYLESVEKQYISGIAVSLLKSSFADLQAQGVSEVETMAQAFEPLSWQGNQDLQICFVVDKLDIFSKDHEPFLQAEGQLLKAIIEKGLRLSTQNVCLLGVDVGHAKSKDAILSKIAAPNVVICGSNLAQFFELNINQGQLEASGTQNFMWTCSLQEVVADSTKKRILWDDLQVVLEKVERN